MSFRNPFNKKAKKTADTTPTTSRLQGTTSRPVPPTSPSATDALLYTPVYTPPPVRSDDCGLSPSGGSHDSGSSHGSSSSSYDGGSSHSSSSSYDSGSSPSCDSGGS